MHNLLRSTLSFCVIWVVFTICSPAPATAGDCDESVTRAVNHLTDVTDRLQIGLPKMKSDINGSLLTVSDPSILEILRLAVYGVVEGRKFLQHLRHEEKPDKQNVCHDANVSEAISERLDNFLSLARVPASPPHNLDPREISDEAIEAKRLEGAITRLDDARATLLAPLLRQIVGASLAISSESTMLLQLDAGVGGSRRKCQLPAMQEDSEDLAGEGLCVGTHFFPGTSYAEQIQILSDPQGVVFHVYPSPAVGGARQALVEYVSSLDLRADPSADIKEISVHGVQLAYAVIELKGGVCVPFYQVLIPDNPFGSVTPHSLNGWFCQPSDGDTKEQIEELVLSLLKRIHIVTFAPGRVNR